MELETATCEAVTLRHSGAKWVTSKFLNCILLLGNRPQKLRIELRSSMWKTFAPFLFLSIAHLYQKNYCVFSHSAMNTWKPPDKWWRGWGGRGGRDKKTLDQHLDVYAYIVLFNNSCEIINLLHSQQFPSKFSFIPSRMKLTPIFHYVLSWNFGHVLMLVFM